MNYFYDRRELIDVLNYADPSLPPREARKDLRDKVYNFMVEKSKYSNYEVYQYIPKNQNTAP